MGHDAGPLLGHVAVPVPPAQRVGAEAGLTAIEPPGTETMFQSKP